MPGNAGLIEASLQDAIQMITASEELSSQTKRHWTTSLRQFAKAIDRPLEVIPARYSAVRNDLAKWHHVPAGLTAKTVMNHRSNAKGALLYLAREKGIPEHGAPLTAAWEELRAKVKDALIRSRLSSFIRNCSANNIAPEEVDEIAVDKFIDYRTRCSKPADAAFRRLLARAWNENVANIPGWPKRQLKEPPIKSAVEIRWDEFSKRLQNEYANYWSTRTLFVDLPVDASGQAEIFWVSLNRDDKDGTPILSRKNKLARSFKDAHERTRGKSVKPQSEACWVVTIDRQLGLDPNASVPPHNLAKLITFLKNCGAPESVVETAIRNGTGLSRWVAIRANNAFCLARIKIPKRFDTQEFMSSRKHNLPQNMKVVATEVPLDRWRGFPIDADFLYGRNLGGLKCLAGKKLAVIGCGTIGGFLALQLAQSGAGSKAGRLVLFDNQILTSSNLGRHLLGLPYLGHNKADGCADLIRTQLPFLDIEARAVDILNHFNTLDEFDLVIDATGEEALSIALNDFTVRKRPNVPPIVYAWIVGNGGAAQAMLCDGPEHACYKCSKPDLAKQPRVRVARSDSAANLRRMGACGDGLFAPFPVSASMAAAALALDLVLAWNNGKPGSLLRTRMLDPVQSIAAKDTTLSPSAACPACGPEVV